LPYPENSLETVFEEASVQLRKQLPFVLYRKPWANKLLGIFQGSRDVNLTTDFTERGFVFAPFNTAQGVVVLQPDKRVSAVLPSMVDDGTETGRATLVEDASAKGAYLKKVHMCIEEIKKGTIRKVVFSRRIHVKTGKSAFSIFEKSLNLYPNAFCYLFYHPQVGTWLGATPETLLRVEGQHLETVSLAGTSAAQTPKWKKKEFDEQQMVTDFIATALSDKTSELNISETSIVKAGKLWHLQTRFVGELHGHVPLRDVVTALHPTPAVCGLPRDKAKTLIERHEGYDRAYYTGFLGELNLHHAGSMEFYVNLRCMQLTGDEAMLYVGGGLTGASDPMAEWQETQNKSRTMLRLL
tara:strand:+ start:89222 stop:90283 length:1062 start_codon:yes stop_codon:yes gene_type:complete